MGRQAVHHNSPQSRAEQSYACQSQFRPLHPHNLQTRPEAQGHTAVGFAPPSEMPFKSHLSTLECSMSLDSGVYVWAPRWHVLMENELYRVRGLLVVSPHTFLLYSKQTGVFTIARGNRNREQQETDQCDGQGALGPGEGEGWIRLPRPERHIPGI